MKLSKMMLGHVRFLINNIRNFFIEKMTEDKLSIC